MHSVFEWSDDYSIVKDCAKCEFWLLETEEGWILMTKEVLYKKNNGCKAVKLCLFATFYLFDYKIKFRVKICSASSYKTSNNWFFRFKLRFDCGEQHRLIRLRVLSSDRLERTQSWQRSRQAPKSANQRLRNGNLNRTGKNGKSQFLNVTGLKRYIRYSY